MSRPDPDYEGLVMPGCQIPAPKDNTRYTQERSPSKIQLSEKKDSDYESIGAAAGKKIPEGIHCNDEGPQNSSDYDYSDPGIYTIEGKVLYSKDGHCDVDKDSGYGNSGLAGSRPSMGAEQDNPSLYYDESMAGYSDGYSADYWLGDEPPPLPPPNKAMAIPLPPPEWGLGSTTNTFEMRPWHYHSLYQKYAIAVTLPLPEKWAYLPVCKYRNPYLKKSRKWPM